MPDLDTVPGRGASETPAARASRGEIVLVIVALLAVGMLATGSLASVPVTVDGVAGRVPVGAVAGDLVSAGDVASPPGDLLSVSGKVLRAGGGRPPGLIVNGAAATSETPLSAGTVVTSARGGDTIEETRTVSIETTPALRFVGSGPVQSVEDSGTPGQVLVVLGTVSGEEVTRTVLSKAEPMIVRSEPAWRGAKRVALTFDDGPWPTTTDEILGQLKAAGVKATFFLLGRQVAARPEMARRIVDAGMEIGNHSYSHKYLSGDPKSVVDSEIAKADAAIFKATGVRPVWYRPAGGITSPTVYGEAARLGHKVVLWSVDPQDWARPGTRRIARRVLDHVRPGAVILLHDGGGNRTETVAALKKILHGLAARGYEAVTLSELYAKP